MKKQIMNSATIIAMVIGTISFVGCGSSEKAEHNDAEEAVSTETDNHAEHDHAHYQCPMDCENGKVYEEEGKCPVCEMDLKEVSTE